MNVLRIFFSTIIITYAMHINAQNFQLVQSLPMARAATYNPLSQAAVSLSLNEASIAGIEKFSAVIASEKRFMLEELVQISALVALPSKVGNFGLKIDRFGSAVINETQAGLVYARKLSPIISLGIQFNYYIRGIQASQKQSAIHAGVGMILHLSDQLVGGVHIYNPTSVQLGKTGERIPSMYSTGIGYRASEKVFLVADMQKIEDQPVNIHTGVHYCMVKRVSVSAGITSAASSLYFGIGYRINFFIVTASAGMHPFLGWSPGLMLAFNGEK